MPSVSSASTTQLFRQQIGTHTNHIDKKAGSRLQQQRLISLLASQPGNNSTNQNQQNLATSMVQVLALMNTLQPTTTVPARMARGNDEVTSEKGLIQQKVTSAGRSLFIAPDVTKTRTFVGAVGGRPASAESNIEKQHPHRHHHLHRPADSEQQVDKTQHHSRLYDFSQMTDIKNKPLAHLLHMVSKKLIKEDIKSENQVYKADSAAKREKIIAIKNINQYVKELAQDLSRLLPDSHPAAIEKYLIAPLFKRAAHDLKHQKIIADNVPDFLQLVAQQAVITISQTSSSEQMLLANKPVQQHGDMAIQLPLIHIKSGHNSIRLEMAGNTRHVPVKQYHGKTVAILSSTNKQQITHPVEFDKLEGVWKGVRK
ncbi:hypothetical protein ACQYRI_11225 [Salmonella enterica]